MGCPVNRRVVYAVTTWLCLQPRKLAMGAAKSLEAARAPSSEPIGPSWNYQNPELNEVLAELERERQAVHTRAAELDALEARLKSERQEICGVTQTVWQLRADLDSMVNNVTEAETANLKKLAKVYSSMAPENAGRILKEMDDSQIVKILAVMKETDSARILENMGQGAEEQAKRAALLSNRLRLTLTPQKKGSAL